MLRAVVSGKQALRGVLTLMACVLTLGGVCHADDPIEYKTPFTVGQNADGRIEYFYVYQGILHHLAQVRPGSTGRDWEYLGPLASSVYTVTSPPLVARNHDGRMILFITMPDEGFPYQNLFYTVQTAPNSRTWTALRRMPLNGNFTDYASVIENQDGRLEYFVGTSHTWQVSRGGDWSGYYPLANFGQTSGVGRNADGRLELFAVNEQWDWNSFKYRHHLMHCWQVAPNSGWSGWESLGGEWKMAFPPAVANETDGRLHVFLVGSDKELHHIWQVAPNSGWSGWDSLHGQWDSRPVVARNADGSLQVFMRGMDHYIYTNRALPYAPWWTGWQRLGSRKTLLDPIVATNTDGRLEVFINDTFDYLHMWQTTAGGNWNGDWQRAHPLTRNEL